MKKGLALILILLILILTLSVAAAGEEGQSAYVLEADKLNALGLFLGTGSNYELPRVPQRVEAAIMLVRLLGRESEALLNSYEHPFTDVPKWANPYVGLLFKENLTKGIGGDLFDPYSDVNAKTYLTFLLRTMNYSDDEGDFSWDSAIDDAVRTGLISNQEHEILMEEEFTRGHMVAVSYNALNNPLKDEKKTLAAQLADVGAIDASTAIEENFLMGIAPEKMYLPYLEQGEYMPYITGLDIETALIMLRKASIDNIEYDYLYDDIAKEGVVLAQSCPAYVISEEAGSCILTISKGPSLLYHEELLEICRGKGWEDEIVLYIIGASKYLIKNTVLSKYDVFNRLEKNLNEIVILNNENSAGMGYAAFYDAGTNNMFINRYILDKELILHELSHAISNNIGTGKVGFHNIGNNSRIVTEAFVESIAAKAMGEDSGGLNYFRTGDEKIVFSSDLYYCDHENNFVLGVFSPLFILAGENTVEKMFFKDINTYSREVLEFNERYGEQMWETLWRMADIFIEKMDFMSEEERIAKAAIYSDYLDGILDCLYSDLMVAGANESRLRLLLLKTRDIKRSYPLEYLNYRKRIEVLEEEIIMQLTDSAQVQRVAESGEWIAPDYYGKQPEHVYNNLTIMGGASAIGYMVVESEENDGSIAGVLYKESGMPTEEAIKLEEGDELPLGGEYFILIPGKILPEGDYVIMRNLVDDFSKYLADYDNLKDYAVGRLLKNEGIRYRFEFIYYDYVIKDMQGRIIGQFPLPGTALIPGETTVRIFMLKERVH